MLKKDRSTNQSIQYTGIEDYLQKVNKLYISGNATEHSYRGDLQTLLAGLLPDCQITNEPKRINCGAPDYIVTRKNIPVGYIEAKDIGVDLKSKSLKEQFERYKNALDNIIITDYLTFQFFKNAELEIEIHLGTIDNNKIKPTPENFEQFMLKIKGFAQHISQSIKNPQHLAEMMANKSRMLAGIIANALNSDRESEENSTLKDQMSAFQKILIHDIQIDDFSDIYAQTIAYGMFAARYHDPTLETFSREEAATLIPKSNPFLRKLFQYIAGYDLDDRIKWVVDELVNIFLASDVAEIMRNFGKNARTEDPVIHFYETFLAAYNPSLRKARGVWYTPQPVVDFIVRAVDDILKSDFGLPQGLADTSKTTIKLKQGGEHDVHKVQILDPATGTGTFLAEVIRYIYKKFQGQKGIWNKYVSDHLIPRINGFELLMASYAIAHLKMDILLSETGYHPSQEQRLRIYLTNSLEEHNEEAGTLFAEWLSKEANQASQIKRDIPVMVILGNPPYSGESQNKGQWIMDLMEDYKKEPGGLVKLNERNPKWINDDYVKFIRYGQYYIEKNGEGILAFINPHGFIDNPTFRGMRWNLLKTYDKIYIIDLHGNSKKKEKAPDGSCDVNVFDIQQGVSINIFIKMGIKNKRDLGKVYKYDLYGKREFKYEFLQKNNLESIHFEQLNINPPNYFFVKRNFDSQKQYESGFSMDTLFNTYSVGIVTARDEFTLHKKKERLKEVIEEFLSLDDEEARKKFDLGRDVRDWTIEFAKNDLISSGPDFNKIIKIFYRPFDDRFTYYTGKSKGFHCMPRNDVMKNYLSGANIGLLCTKSFKDTSFAHVFITKNITEAIFLSPQTGSNAMNFPLYIFCDFQGIKNLNFAPERTPNLNREIVNQISDSLGLVFTNEKEVSTGTFSPIDILDYIYAVLHSPCYREKYKEFLKIDFPRVPYPKDVDMFWKLVALGGELRELHLLESQKIETFITQYPEDGDNVISKLKYENNNVYINDRQYFANVPEVAWGFFIGGYQPAQKWLKDRKGKELSYDDILHYQKMIVAMTETARIMEEIDSLGFECFC